MLQGLRGKQGAGRRADEGRVVCDRKGASRCSDGGAPVKPYDGRDFRDMIAEQHEQAVCIAREELTRLDAEMQRAAKDHETLVTAWGQAPENRRQRLFGRSIEDARFRDGQAAGAFEGARRLAERLGLIAEGEREFYKEKKT